MLYTLKLITVELICSQVVHYSYMYSICAELRDDCLEDADKYFVRRPRTCYSVTNKDRQICRGC